MTSRQLREREVEGAAFATQVKGYLLRLQNMPAQDRHVAVSTTLTYLNKTATLDTLDKIFVESLDTFREALERLREITEVELGV